ncbi:hypothetical protein LMIY3S_03454 [Labrys miyagiensis]
MGEPSIVHLLVLLVILAVPVGLLVLVIRWKPHR